MSRGLVWLTNAPAPYRVPLWQRLGEAHTVEVFFVGPKVEGHDWKVPGGIAFRTRTSRLMTPTIVYRLVTSDSVVVGMWERPAVILAVALRRLLGRPSVSFYESTALTHRFQSGPVAWVRRWSFHRVDAVLTAGPASTDAVLAMGVPRERIITGFNSVDVAAFAEGAGKVRETLSRPPGHRFLYVGQLIARKNVEAALRAFAAVAQQEDEFFIVGTGPEQPFLERLVARSGLEDRVHFIGHRDGDALCEEYGSADTLVLPSTEEVWGLVVNEALASGLHVVVSESAGVVPSVAHMAGVFVATPTVEGIAEQMAASRALWNGPVSAPEMLKHTPDQAATAVLQALEKATQLGRHRRGRP